MNLPVLHRDNLVKAMRWAARLFSVLLLLLWGAFFIEHLSWFGGQAKPPLFVWLLQALHLVLLLSFLAVLRWEVIGSWFIIGSALVFFAQTASRNFLPFFGISILPAVLFLLCYWQERTAVSPDWKGRVT